MTITPSSPPTAFSLRPYSLPPPNCHLSTFNPHLLPISSILIPLSSPSTPHSFSLLPHLFTVTPSAPASNQISVARRLYDRPAVERDEGEDTRMRWARGKGTVLGGMSPVWPYMGTSPEASSPSLRVYKYMYHYMIMWLHVCVTPLPPPPSFLPSPHPCLLSIDRT